MSERVRHFGEICIVHKDVKVGEIEIHPQDTVMQQYGMSKSVQYLVRDVASDGTLHLFETPHSEVPFLFPGASLSAVFCSHKG